MDLYKQLWPDEQIKCPWGEEDSPDTIAPKEPIDSSRTVKTLSQDVKALELVSLSPVFTDKVTRSTAEQLDLDPLRTWLTTCDRDPEHAACRATPITWLELPGVSLKVIDVERSCIVDAPEHCSFIALTYVWGNTKQPRLTTQTAPLLMHEGGLDTIWPDLPMTIRDAILLCRYLKERYLWVDALCIKQDSIREMKIQILRMRQIYSAAKCTIAAVSAESADVGLLGTNEGNPPSDGTSSCRTVEELEDLLETAPWSSRAWCYQEKVLSHRILMFTSAGIYMHCQRTILTSTGLPLRRSDGTLGISSTPYTRFDAVGSMLSASPGEDLESYVSAVEFYSKRYLTKLSDKQNAFQGIFKRYQGVIDGAQSAFYFGLCMSAFDQTFCWRSSKHFPNSRNPAFPSWSWLGWQVGVEFDRTMIHAARTKQMVFPNNSGGYPGRYASLSLRKPASDKQGFGFPGSARYMFNSSRDLTLYASVAHLRIDADAEGGNDEHGSYAVWATTCYHHSSTHKAMSDDSSSDDDYCLPVELTHYHHDLMAPCNAEGVCIAKEPLGYISLDRNWRAGKGEECVMEFMALAGEKDEMWEGEWVVTMLMCLQRQRGRLERVQVMDCEFNELYWLEAGAANTIVSLE